MFSRRFISADIEQMEKRFRTNLVNSLSGFSPANLIGTRSQSGQSNLAIFSSAVHLGANPALQGIIVRPTSVDRHTYQNILETKNFTINHVNLDILSKAHQTSARYHKKESEFDAVGLTEEQGEYLKAPYVLESQVKVGLELAEIIDIKSNGTHLIIGKIVEIMLAPNLLMEEGRLDLNSAGSVVAAGLDSYSITRKIGKYEYAKPNRPTTMF